MPDSNIRQQVEAAWGKPLSDEDFEILVVDCTSFPFCSKEQMLKDIEHLKNVSGGDVSAAINYVSNRMSEELENLLDKR